jgi:PelA/Pel-15E family pectate lyase
LYFSIGSNNVFLELIMQISPKYLKPLNISLGGLGIIFALGLIGGFIYATIVIVAPHEHLIPYANALKVIIGVLTLSTAILILSGIGCAVKKYSPSKPLLFMFTTLFLLSLFIYTPMLPIMQSIDFSFWIIRNNGPIFENAFDVLWLCLLLYLISGVIFSATYAFSNAPKKFYRTQIALFIATMIIGSSGFVYYFVTEEPGNFQGCVGASDPIYDLPTGSHYSPALDTMDTFNQTLLEKLEFALWSFQKLRQPCGGFPMYCDPDFCQFVGDGGVLYPNEIDLQAGTPRVGRAYLSMYALEPNPIYLLMARGAADALVQAQDDVNGGFSKYARFDENNQIIEPNPRNPRRHSSYDDNTCQGCMDYLLDFYNATHEAKYLNAINFGLDGIFATQYEWGAWPQETNYIYPYYQIWSTLNDGLMYDMLMMLYKASKVVPARAAECIASIKIALNWLIDVQGNGGSAIQQAWAQQYDFSQQPTWARRFEPPAFDARITTQLIGMFLDFYCIFNDSLYLTPIQGAIDWLNASKFTFTNDKGETEVGWARLYEPITNVPIFGIAEGGADRNPQYVYKIEDARGGYGWTTTSGYRTFEEWAYLQSHNFNITEFWAWKYGRDGIDALYKEATEKLNELNTDGLWIDGEDRIHSELFARNVEKVILYFKSK